MQQLSAAALALEASLAQQLDGLPTKALCSTPNRTLML